MQWFIDRLNERSTWLGLVSLLTAVGVGIDPNQSAAIASAGVAVASVVAIFSRDKT